MKLTLILILGLWVVYLGFVIHRVDSNEKELVRRLQSYSFTEIDCYKMGYSADFVEKQFVGCSDDKDKVTIHPGLASSTLSL